MPIPVSRTSTITPPPPPPATSDVRTVDPSAVGRELHRVADQVEEDLLKPGRVADHVRRAAPGS